MRPQRDRPGAGALILTLAAAVLTSWVSTAPRGSGAAAAKPRPDREEMPERYWRADAYLACQPPGDRFLFTVHRDPRMGFNFGVRPADLRVTVSDAKGRRLKTDARFVPAPGTPEVLTPIPVADPSLGEIEQIRIVLRLERNGLQPGLYQLDASVPVKAYRTRTGQPYPLPVVKAYSSRFYLPPEPDRRPSLASGQRFLCLPEPGEELPCKDANGRPIPRRQIALRVLTLERIERRPGQKPLLTFALDQFPGKAQLQSGDDVTSLPQLHPLVEDNTLRRLQAKYEGKRVWSYGGFGAACITDSATEYGSLGMGRSATFVVRRLVRLYGISVPLLIGSAPGVGASEFHAPNPIVAVLDQPQDLGFTGMAWSGSAVPGGGGDPIAELRARAIGFYTHFSDAWDLEREYSLVPVGKAHPEWSRSIHRAVKEGRLQKGMTPEMVSWIMGWPSEYGTPAEMKQWKAWRYDGPPPFSFWVRFRNGRVVSWGDDGRLP